MNEDTKRPLSTLALIVFVIPFVYVLSIGPAARLNKMGIIPDSAGKLYWPLQKATDHVPAAKRFFQWYVRLWT